MFNSRKRRIIKKIRSKEKINVIFLVNENAKWKAQKVFDKLLKHPRFNPQILLTIADYDIYCSKIQRQNKIKENQEFFKKRNIKTELAWDIEKDCAIDIKKFDPDIIFYQVPYNISNNQDIDYTRQDALCFYIPYYINQSEELNFMGTKNWHKKLDRFYVFNNYWKKAISKKLGASSNLKPVGHPFFDIDIKEGDNDLIVYAAHWSVGLPEGLSAFLETGHFMLNYAKKHPEFKWVFTHHPTFLFNVVDKGYMTQNELDDYINEWKKIGYQGSNGDYLELFKNSKMLISDCSSYRIEYYKTAKPYIYIISSNPKRVKDDKFFNKITKNYYKAHNVSELKFHLDNLLLNNFDPLKEGRKKDRYEFKNQNSADLIIKDIENLIKINPA